MVIDYVMGSEEVREKIAATRIGDRMESDHHPLEVRIGNDGERSGREGGEGRRWERSMESGGTRKVQAKGGRTAGEGMGRGGGDVEEGAEGNAEEQELGKEKGKRTRWWDEECGRKKREVRRELRKWRRGRGNEAEYKRGKWERI